MISESDIVKINDVSTIPNEYKPIIFKLDTISKQSQKHKKIYDASPELSHNIDYPLMSLGFQQYLHANVNKMDIIKEFIGKKKVYTTMHLFEPKISEYDASIETVTVEYFRMSDEQKILGNNFYKMWEMLLTLNSISRNILDVKQQNSVHMFDDDCSIIQALSMYKKLFGYGKKQTYYAISHNIPPNEVLTNPQKEKIEQLPIPVDTQIIQSGMITKLSETVGDTVGFVTAFGTTNWKYSITQEQELIKPVISEIACALNILNNGGTFVCRLYETFTMTMCRLIYVISTLFDDVYLMKPLMSHQTTSERFLVCCGYNQNAKITEQFNKTLKIMSEHRDMNIVNIFPDLYVSDEFRMALSCANTEIANHQIIGINKVVSFIKSQNYFGDMYNIGRTEQINASTYWINMYYPNDTEIKKELKNIKNVINVSISQSNNNIKKYSQFV